MSANDLSDYNSINTSEKKTAFTTNKKNHAFNSLLNLEENDNRTVSIFNNNINDDIVMKEESEQEIKKMNKIFCPKCFCHPEIILDENESAIMINCNNCQITKVYTNTEFKNIYDNDINLKNILCSFCGNNIYSKEYISGNICGKCKKVICNNCQNNIFITCKAKKHQLYSLSEISSFCQKHNMEYIYYDKCSKENLCQLCLAENNEFLLKENIEKIYNKDKFMELYSSACTYIKIQNEKLDTLYKTFLELIEKFKNILNQFYEQEKLNLLIKNYIIEESKNIDNICYNIIHNMENILTNQTKYDLFEDNNKLDFKKKFLIMIEYIFSGKIKNGDDNLSNKYLTTFSDIIFHEMNSGISEYKNNKTNKMVKFKKIDYISEFDLKKYNSTCFKNVNSCLLLSEENGVIICVLNPKLTKIENSLLLNNDNCIKSIQLSNGDILCLNKDNKLFIYKQVNINEFLTDLFKTYAEIIDPINITISKRKKNHRLTLYNNSNSYFPDIFNVDEFENNPNCVNIFSNIITFNFIEKIVDNNFIALLIYGKSIFSRGGYSNQSFIFYSNIANINYNNNKTEKIASSEDLEIYIFADFSNNNVGYNYMEKGQVFIGIINVINKEKILCINIEGNILDFGLNFNNNLIVCFRNFEQSIKYGLMEVFKYYIEEIDIKNNNCISLRNTFVSKTIKNNVILSINKENNTIFYVCPENSTLFLFK